MKRTQLEMLVNKVHRANCDRDTDIIKYNELKALLGTWVYALAFRGKLYTKNSKGEIVKIDIDKEAAHGE